MVRIAKAGFEAFHDGDIHVEWDELSPELQRDWIDAAMAMCETYDVIRNELGLNG